MNNRGYIYVLANSSMPDLVKVGKTARSPSQRALELSGVTGVPTPFIVVYEQLFEDCSVAEDFLHTVLKQRGYRETDNREFFRAPVSEIIHIISKMPGQIRDSSDLNTESFNDGLISNHARDELDDLAIEELPESYPWSGVWTTAENYHYGIDDYIQDYSEAMKLYSEAAKLGCLMAYHRIGQMFLYGQGVPKSCEKALEYLKEGARKGNYYCYYAMGKLFLFSNQQENYRKCMRLFFRNRNEQVNTVIERYTKFHQICSDYIMYCFLYETYPLQEAWKEMADVKNEIIKWMHSMIRNLEDKSDTRCIEDFKKAISWVNQNL